MQLCAGAGCDGVNCFITACTLPACTKIVLIAHQCLRCCWTGLAGSQGFLCSSALSRTGAGWGWQEAGSGHSQDSNTGCPKGCWVSCSARLSHRTGDWAFPQHPLFGGWLGTGLLLGGEKWLPLRLFAFPYPFPSFLKLLLYLDPQVFSLLLFWFCPPCHCGGVCVLLGGVITPYTENRK